MLVVYLNFVQEALTIHRLHFAFTVTFHYLFPQLTMGLALLIFILKTAALRTEWNGAGNFVFCADV